MLESATRCESDVRNENYAFNGCWARIGTIMTGLRSEKCGVRISAGSRLVPECPDQLFELPLLFSGTGSSSLRVKLPELEADQPFPSRAEFENEMSYNYTCLTLWCAQGQIYL